MPRAVLLVGAVACALVIAATAKDSTFEGPLDSFALCTPFAVYFVPTEAPETTVTISDNAAGALSLSQVNQTLFITAAAQDWSSGEVIKITVTTPAGRGQDLLLGLAGGEPACLPAQSVLAVQQPLGRGGHGCISRGVVASWPTRLIAWTGI